jgi:F-actin capping protein alpha subunit
VTSSPSASASKILALIEDEEGKYQTSLNDTYHEMGEKTFKGLRRALPLTRQKLDWDKVGTRLTFFWLRFMVPNVSNVSGAWLQAGRRIIIEQGRFW